MGNKTSIAEAITAAAVPYKKQKALKSIIDILSDTKSTPALSHEEIDVLYRLFTDSVTIESDEKVILLCIRGIGELANLKIVPSVKNDSCIELLSNMIENSNMESVQAACIKSLECMAKSNLIPSYAISQIVSLLVKKSNEANLIVKSSALKCLSTLVSLSIIPVTFVNKVLEVAEYRLAGKNEYLWFIANTIICSTIEMNYLPSDHVSKIMKILAEKCKSRNHTIRASVLSTIVYFAQHNLLSGAAVDDLVATVVHQVSHDDNIDVRTNAMNAVEEFSKLEDINANSCKMIYHAMIIKINDRIEKIRHKAYSCLANISMKKLDIPITDISKFIESFIRKSDDSNDEIKALAIAIICYLSSIKDLPESTLISVVTLLMKKLNSGIDAVKIKVLLGLKFLFESEVINETKQNEIYNVLYKRLHSETNEDVKATTLDCTGALGAHSASYDIIKSIVSIAIYSYNDPNSPLIRFHAISILYELVKNKKVDNTDRVSIMISSKNKSPKMINSNIVLPSTSLLEQIISFLLANTSDSSENVRVVILSIFFHIIESDVSIVKSTKNLQTSLIELGLSAVNENIAKARVVSFAILAKLADEGLITGTYTSPAVKLSLGKFEDVDASVKNLAVTTIIHLIRRNQIPEGSHSKVVDAIRSILTAYADEDTCIKACMVVGYYSRNRLEAVDSNLIRYGIFYLLSHIDNDTLLLRAFSGFCVYLPYLKTTYEYYELSIKITEIVDNIFDSKVIPVIKLGTIVSQESVLADDIPIFPNDAMAKLPVTVLAMIKGLQKYKSKVDISILLIKFEKPDTFGSIVNDAVGIQNSVVLNKNIPGTALATNAMSSIFTLFTMNPTNFISDASQNYLPNYGNEDKSPDDIEITTNMKKGLEYDNFLLESFGVRLKPHIEDLMKEILGDSFGDQTGFIGIKTFVTSTTTSIFHRLSGDLNSNIIDTCSMISQNADVNNKYALYERLIELCLLIDDKDSQSSIISKHPKTISKVIDIFINGCNDDNRDVVNLSIFGIMNICRAIPSAKTASIVTLFMSKMNHPDSYVAANIMLAVFYFCDLNLITASKIPQLVKALLTAAEKEDSFHKTKRNCIMSFTTLAKNGNIPTSYVGDIADLVITELKNNYRNSFALHKAVNEKYYFEYKDKTIVTAAVTCIRYLIELHLIAVPLLYSLRDLLQSLANNNVNVDLSQRSSQSLSLVLKQISGQVGAYSSKISTTGRPLSFGIKKPITNFVKPDGNGSLSPFAGSDTHDGSQMSIRSGVSSKNPGSPRAVTSRSASPFNTTTSQRY